MQAGSSRNHDVGDLQEQSEWKQTRQIKLSKQTQGMEFRTPTDKCTSAEEHQELESRKSDANGFPIIKETAGNESQRAERSHIIPVSR